MSSFNDNIINNPFISHLPESMKDFPRGLFDSFPVFTPSEGSIEKGYDRLAEMIEQNIPAGLRVLIIDGYQGIEWNKLIDELILSLNKLKIQPEFIDVSGCYVPPEVLRKRAEPFLGGDDPLFGTHYPFGAEVFFDVEKIAQLRIELSVRRGQKSGGLTIIYGTGSSLVEQCDELWYIDVPKDYIQMLAREEKITNVGEKEILSFGDFYKRSYFFDWPALNRLKQQILPKVDVFIDCTNLQEPAFIDGEDFRKAVYEISESPFRVRPWFFPGPWGGKFMQGHMGLDPEQPNFAWSFELIVPENGIILEKNENILEFSFDCLMYLQNERVLGRNAARQFKYEWPIRLDYLDTIDGGNLSTQVHPKPNYIRNNFGETYTQDETYYIVASKPGSRVYLGLTDWCDPDEFKHALEDSINKGEELDIDRFVNSEPSKPHDLFLIPNGTVHCSGKGNLVLEISATPYIFTFKIYDYLRRDLEGKLRPLNIERAFENIRFERREKWVKENLVAKPKLIKDGGAWKEYELYNSPFTFYNIHRIEFDSAFEYETDGRALAVNLVEGEWVEITASNKKCVKLSYMESMVIPAAAKKIIVENKGARPCRMVLVYIKPQIGAKLPINKPEE